MKLEGKHGAVSGSGLYKIGTKVTLTVIPDMGYEFVKWEDGNTDNPRIIVAEKTPVKYVALYAKSKAKPVVDDEPVIVEQETAEESVEDDNAVEEVAIVEENIDLEDTTEKEKPKKVVSKKKKTE